MSDIYDLLVIGGGPAGSSAAITAAQLGLHVSLLEAGSFPRHKVCGEFVSGEAFAVLEQLLDRSDPFVNFPLISRTRIFVGDHMAELPVSPPALSIPRYELDFVLWQEAAIVGVQTRERSGVKGVRRSGESFVLATENGEARARAVIDASGRWSKLRRVKPAAAGTSIGLKGHFYEESGSEACDLYFFPGGYCGVQPLGSGRVNASAMVRSDVARTLAEVFSRNRELEARTRKWRPASEPVSTAPLFFSTPRTNDREMAFVGDAAAFIDPFAGDGISIALHSGRLAALALSSYLRGESALSCALKVYDKQYRELIQPALRNAAQLRRILHLSRPLQLAAVSLLKIPIIARAAVRQTRIRQAS